GRLHVDLHAAEALPLHQWSACGSSDGRLRVWPQGLARQFSCAAAPTRQAGSGISRYSESAVTKGSYIRRISASLSSAPAPASTTTPAAASPARSWASSDAGSRSGDESMGGRPSTCARSTTACRAIANVNLAWRAQASWMPTITSALASRIVVSAVSHDWLSCCERYYDSTGYERCDSSTSALQRSHSRSNAVSSSWS